MSRPITGFVAAGLLAVAVNAWGGPATVHADPFVARDADVIVEWNKITERTLAENPPPNAPPNEAPLFRAIMYYGFTALAMYDAVVTIEGGYQPWTNLPRAKAHASPEVAAVTAAYRVLVHYFPNSASALAVDYQAALAEVPNGVGKTHGIRVGRQAAAALIARHPEQGINAPFPQPHDEPLLPGEWRPTASGPMAATWFKLVDPLVLPAPIHLPGPPALTSAQYAADFAEVRDYGGTVSQRTQAQTDTALFHTVSPRFQHVDAMRDQITGRNLDIVDAAHTLAVFHASLADAAISCWRNKWDHKFWRPETAIALADTDNNPATNVVTGWTPLRTTPPYPDYPSGHACFTGSVSGTLDNLFGPGPLTYPYTMNSNITGVPNRTYPTTDALDTETMNARIWNGFHFRAAMTDGNNLGHTTADIVASTLHATG